MNPPPGGLLSTADHRKLSEVEFNTAGGDATSNHPRLTLTAESGIKVMQRKKLERRKRFSPGCTERAGTNTGSGEFGSCMNSPLSQNELVILDRQMAMVARHLSEIALLLESRLGETTDMAVSARIIEQGFGDLARKIHNQSVQIAPDSVLISKSQSA